VLCAIDIDSLALVVRDGLVGLARVCGRVTGSVWCFGNAQVAIGVWRTDNMGHERAPGA